MTFDESLGATKKRLGQQLRQYRGAMDVDRVAERLGLHRTTIYKIEAGQIGSLDTVARLLWEYGLTLDDFLAGFRDLDIPEEHKAEHQRLKDILVAGYQAQIAVVQAALESVHSKVRALQAATLQEHKSRPRPKGPASRRAR